MKLKLVLLFILVPGLALAWGRVGHATVALIAQDYLSPHAQAEISSLIGEGVGLDEIASCADDIKRHNVVCAGKFELDQDPRTNRWHFLDYPISEKMDLASIPVHCGAKGNCITNEFAIQSMILRDHSFKIPERRKALLFIVHLMGDLHQPLHCAHELDEEGNTDSGGNGKLVHFSGLDRPMNLHHLWDNLIEKDSVARRTNPHQLAKTLEKTMPVGPDLRPWFFGDEKTWAAASFYIAQETIYPAFYEDHGDTIDSAYQKRMQPIVYLQLQKAGARLAYVLNTLLQEDASIVGPSKDGGM